MRDNFKRSALAFLVIILALNLSGCETLKKKFIRKSKTTKKTTPVLMTQDYKGMYSNEVLYNNHFTYWRTWSEELVNCLTNKLSNKREVLAATRAIEDLQRMQDLLNSPKKEELDPYIKFYKGVQKKVELGQPNEADAARMTSELESRRRIILRKFETKEVKAFILKEEEAIKPMQTIEQTLPNK